jgi:glycosyltransferase involved in cell wall biosynthesis
MSNNLPQIDISIVTHNSERWIGKFFDSLSGQAYPTHLINILLTDNQSTDRTLELCNYLLENYALKFKSFNLFNCPNLGFGYGHNNNLSKGNSKYFLVTNVDLEFANDAISEVINTAISDSDDIASWEFRQKPFEHPKYYNPVTLETYWSSSACVLFRRSALEKVTGYEERIFLYGEDVELSYRLRDNGFKLKYCPSAVCWHYTYEYANQVKRLQFLGSTLANSFIRLRYGSLKQILTIPVMYLKLFFSPPSIKNQKSALLNNIFLVIYSSIYFLSTRKKSRNLFPINKWDYGFMRDGAFYQYSQDSNLYSPLVSVIIRTYKGRLSYLKEAVTSVINQTYKNLELIVVEDGSNETKDYMSQVSSNTCLKVVYKEEPKKGRCHTGNIGLSLSSGKFIVFLDDDDLFFADHVEVLVEALLKNPDISAAYSTSCEVATKVHSVNPLKYTELSHEIKYRQRFSRLLMLHHNYIPIQSIMFDRKLYDKYGGFDESLDNLEDWNLWTRYCVDHNFMLIEKTTSLYRIDNNIYSRMQRQKSLDNYYPLAIEKQKNIEITVSRQEIMDFYEEMLRYNYISKTNKLRLKSFLFKYNILKKIYYFLFAFKNKKV